MRENHHDGGIAISMQKQKQKGNFTFNQIQPKSNNQPNNQLNISTHTLPTPESPMISNLKR